MAKPKGPFDTSFGNPGLQVLQWFQENLPPEKVAEITYTKEFAVTADATGALEITGVPLNARIIGARVICTAANASGTLQLRTNATTPVAITDAMICAVDKVVVYAGTIDDAVTTVGVDGLQVISNGADDRGIILIEYKV